MNRRRPEPKYSAAASAASKELSRCRRIEPDLRRESSIRRLLTKMEGGGPEQSRSSRSLTSQKSAKTCDTRGTEDSSSANSADSALSLDLEESRRVVRTLRREAKIRAAETARFRILVEALSNERECLWRYREMCESAMEEARNLREERDELKEMLNSVLVGQHTMAQEDEEDQHESTVPSRRRSSFSEDGEEMDDGSSFRIDSFRFAPRHEAPRWQQHHHGGRGGQRRHSLLGGVGGVFSSLVKNVTNASSGSLQSLGREVQPQRRRATDGGDDCIHNASLRSLASIEEKDAAGGVLEMDDMTATAVPQSASSRAPRHSSMPIVSSTMQDSDRSLSSWNVGGPAAAKEDEGDGTFLSWEESCHSAVAADDEDKDCAAATTSPLREEVAVAAAAAVLTPNGEGRAAGVAPEDTPESPEGGAAGADAGERVGTTRATRSGSILSRRGSACSACSCGGQGQGQGGGRQRARAGSFVASRRNTEKDVEEFMACIACLDLEGDEELMMLEDEEALADNCDTERHAEGAE